MSDVDLILIYKRFEEIDRQLKELKAEVFGLPPVPIEKPKEKKDE